MNRRILLSLAGIGAAGAGAFLATRKHEPVPVAVAEGASSRPAAMAASEAAGTPEITDLWSHRFERPEGGELALASLRGKPLILNFWATWCAPCVKEMPDLDRFAREYAAKGWQVAGLAIDNAPQVREFLEKTPVQFPIGLAGFAGTEVARSLGNASGGLPFSVAFNGAGEIVQRKLGATEFAELARWAT